VSRRTRFPLLRSCQSFVISTDIVNRQMHPVDVTEGHEVILKELPICDGTNHVSSVGLSGKRDDIVVALDVDFLFAFCH
jgi:hypothetical protein